VLENRGTVFLTGKNAKQTSFERKGKKKRKEKELSAFAARRDWKRVEKAIKEAHVRDKPLSIMTH